MDKLFNGISPLKFYKEYWNKKPMLFKNAISSTEALGDFSDFFEMSYDPDFETRMVYESGGDYPWQAKVGPFKKSDFKKNALWTLICHNLECFNEDLYNIKENLNFISLWNFDDVMATVSNKGASVGAHVDDYSVFIFQGKGTRKWLIETNPDCDHLPDLDIKLLKKFNPNIEWILEPGDMIYLPPNVAHHGISLSDSISYSIGFKSIRYNELLETIVKNDLLIGESLSFHDAKNKVIQDRFEIPEYVVKDIQAQLLKTLSNTELIQNALATHLSKTKNLVWDVQEFDKAKLKKLLKTKKLNRDVWAKLVSIKLNSNKIQMTINKIHIVATNVNYKKIRAYFELSPFKDFKLSKDDLENQFIFDFFMECLKNGIFFVVD